MRRRRLLLLAVVAIALACVCARSCGQGGPDPSSAPPAPAPPPAAPPPAAPPAAPPVLAGPTIAPGSPRSPAPDGQAGQESADDAEGVVTGDETLAASEVPAAVRAAERFARVWARPDARWPEPLVDLATPALADALARSATGPPEREITGDGFLLFDAPRWARVGVPTADGTIVLDLSLVDDRWLVSAVAWWPGPVEVSP